MRRTVVATFAAIWMAAQAHAAETCNAPCAGYDLTGELNSDWIVASDPSSLRSIDTGPNLTGEFWFSPIENFKLVGEITTEPVLDKDEGVNRFFKDVGTYVGGLYGEFDIDPLTIRAGKFDPGFSLASEQLRGLHAADIVGIFDTDERLGGEVSLVFNALGLEQQFTVDAFTTDRTLLSRSLFTDRGRLRLSDGGAGNTAGLSSFSARLDGCIGAAAEACAEDGEFGYRLALRYQRQGHLTEEDVEEELKTYPETAFLAAVMNRTEMGGDTLRLMAEAGFLKHAEGSPDDALVATVSAAYETGSMTYEAAYSLQHDFIAGEPGVNEHLIDLTAIYAFDESFSVAGEAWSVAAGYSFNRNADGESAHVIGLRLSAELPGHTGHEEQGGSEED